MSDSAPRRAALSCVAVIPARRAETTISATLEALRIGNDAFVRDVVVVTSAQDPTARVVREWSRHDARVHLVVGDSPMSAGTARNAGRDFVRDAGLLPVDGSCDALLLFIDADCRLAADGAQRLALELTAAAAAAVSARVIGHAGAIARVRHILEFKEAASMRTPPPAWLPPSTTMLCRADAFDRVGGFPNLWPGEDLVFSQALRDCGERVLRSTNVTTLHRHPDGFVEMLRHQYRLGHTAAIARRTGTRTAETRTAGTRSTRALALDTRPSNQRALDTNAADTNVADTNVADTNVVERMRGTFFARHRWAAALLLPGRVVRIAAWQAREGTVALLWTALLSPLLLVGLVCWTAGFVAGAGVGVGIPVATPQRRRLRGRGEGEDGTTLRPPLVAEFATDRGRRARAVAIVPVFNGSEVLGECLDSLLASDDRHLDILVVDDASRDASLALARDKAATSGGRVRVLALERNHGFAGAVNRAVAWTLAQGDAPDVLALVNQDCFVSQGWLGPLAKALEDPTVAVAGARLLDVDGTTLQHAGARIEANGLTSHFGRGCRDPLAWRTQLDVDYVCGAVIAMRAQTWRDIGPLDEGYAPAYFEEVDLCVKARRAGRRVVYVPGCEARHVEASTSGVLSRTFLHRYHRNRLRFVIRRHLGEIGTIAWLRSEARWLSRLRRWAQIAPVLVAYSKIPLFLAELVIDRRAARDVLPAVDVRCCDGRASHGVAAVAAAVVPGASR